MPLYEIHTLDVWGNATDGFEINDQHRAGEVYVRPAPEIQADGNIDYDHQQDADQADYGLSIIEALVENGSLGRDAIAEYIGRNLTIERGDPTIEIFQEDGRPVLILEETQLTDASDKDDRFWQGARDEYPDEVPGGKHVKALAAEFSLRLRRELPPNEMARVIQLNAAEEDVDVICHSHDFCDANVPMAEAFEAVVGHQIGSSKKDLDTWNAAWTLAKSREFEVPLRINGYYVGDRISFEVFTSSVGITFDVVDNFEWYLADWQRKPTLGFNPVTGDQLTLSKKEVAEILVSLDRFMSRSEE